MDKRIRKSIMVIISMVLILVMLGVSFAWADSTNTEQESPFQGSSLKPNQEDGHSDEESSGNRTIVATTFFVESGSPQNTVSYDTAGGTYGTLPTPIMSDMIFVGWYPDPMEEGVEVVAGSIVPQEDTTLYAHWAWVQTLSTKAADGVMLNIYGSNITYLYNGMNVTMWSFSGSNEQKWLIGYYTSKFYIRSYVDPEYGLNVYRAGSPWNCTMHFIRGNETDAQIDVEPLSGGFYRYWLSNWDLILTAAGTSNGSNVYWSDSYEGDLQKW